MWSELEITWSGAVEVVIATVVIYLIFVGLVRLLGQRTMTATASTDLALVVAVGAVIGRTTLLETPTLAAGVISIVTLFGMQAAFRGLRRRPWAHDLTNARPTLLVAGGEIVTANLRRAGMDEADVYQRLRMVGVASVADVAAVVLERNGAISVLRAGVRIDPAVIADLSPDAELRLRVQSSGVAGPAA